MRQTYIINKLYVKGVLRLSKKTCSNCGIEKDLNEFYFNNNFKNEYGIDDPKSYRNICKVCSSLKSKENREKHLQYTKGLYFVYFIYNYDNELIYIGKTNDLCNRIYQHEKEKRFCVDDINYIEYELLNSLCDASVREIYYINKYKPILNQRDLFEGEILDTAMNELNKNKIYVSNKEQIKADIEKSIKNNKKNKNSNKPVLKIDPNTRQIIQQYNSCKEAEKANSISESGVSRAAKKGGKAGGFYWEYLDTEDKSTDRYGK